MSVDERMMILQMVSEKKISAAEAAELLRVLDDSRPLTAPVAAASVSGQQAFRAAEPPQLTGFGSLIENLVERVTTAFADGGGSKYEFPFEYTGRFGAGEVPLQVVTGNGRVELKAWDQPEYKAIVLVKIAGASEEEARARAQEAFTVTAGEGGFELQARKDLWPSEPTVHLTLMLPRSGEYRCDVRTGNGRIETEGLILTEACATTGNGRILLQGGRAGRAVIKSGNGSIEVTADIAELEASSGNGSVTVSPFGAGKRSMKVTTGNGSVKVLTRGLSPDTRCRVDAHTGMGSIAMGLTGIVHERNVRAHGHKHIIAQHPDFDQAAEKALIQARTGMGSITIG